MASEGKIVVNHYIKSTTVLGPGNRFVVWTQGCNKRCKGCINPYGWSLDGGIEMDINALLDLIITQKDIQGITISGGEPFLQFKSIFELIVKVKTMTKLDVMLYSGYTYEELQNMIPDKVCKTFFGYVDIFVDGEYIDELNDNQMFRGSSNQNIYFFTPKYEMYKDNILKNKTRDIEFDVNPNSDVFMVGIPPKNFYDDFVDMLKKEEN